MKHRNDENRSAGRSRDCCSSKLPEFNHVWVWAFTAGCSAPVRHHRSPLGPGSIQGLPQPNSCRLITDHPLNVKCFAVSATISDYLWEIFITYKTCWDILMKTKMTANVLITWKTKPPPPKKTVKHKSVRTILHRILQNSKTLSTVIEQCTTKDNTRLQCFWLEVITYVQRWKWPFF